MSTVINTDEEAFWSGPSGQSWIAYEAEQDRLLAEASDAVIDRSGLRPGERVLDIGCGTGALSVAAASAVTASGRVLATDISPPLLARASERLAGNPQADTLLADAEAVVWPEVGFDAAISRFGVMFFGNPPQAFANIAGALRPGARIVFAAWGPVAKNVYWRDPARIAADRLASPPASKPNTPGPMGMSDKDWSLAQLRSAGLVNVACEEVEIGLIIAGPPDEAADLVLAIGPAARVIRLFEGTEADVIAIREAVARELEAYVDGPNIRIPALIHLYTAHTA